MRGGGDAAVNTNGDETGVDAVSDKNNGDGGDAVNTNGDETGVDAVSDKKYW